MTRAEKINLLQSIKKGKATIDSLQPFKIYMFEKDNKRPDIFKLNGKEYDVSKFKEVRESIKSDNCIIFIWDETKDYQL